MAQDIGAVVAWRRTNGASIKDTASHFKVPISSVKRYRSAAAK